MCASRKLMQLEPLFSHFEGNVVDNIWFQRRHQFLFSTIDCWSASNIFASWSMRFLLLSFHLFPPFLPKGWLHLVLATLQSNFPRGCLFQDFIRSVLQQWALHEIHHALINNINKIIWTIKIRRVTHGISSLNTIFSLPTLKTILPSLMSSTVCEVAKTGHLRINGTSTLSSKSRMTKSTRKMNLSTFTRTSSMIPLGWRIY